MPGDKPHIGLTCDRFDLRLEVRHIPPMSTWQERLEVGKLLERRVPEELSARGWHVNPGGQGVLDEPIRAALKRGYGEGIRHTPDLIAARGDEVVLIDCKGRMTSRDTGRHSLSRGSVRAHRQIEAVHDVPIYYVFDDLGVLSPYEVVKIGRRGPHDRIGRRAYYLIDAGLTRPFDAVFGAAPPVGHRAGLLISRPHPAQHAAAPPTRWRLQVV